MKIWDGSCVVHEEYKTLELKKLINKLDDCEVLVHPESPRSIIQLADVVGSTTKLINASKSSKSKNIIVATEKESLSNEKLSLRKISMRLLQKVKALHVKLWKVPMDES